MDSLGIGGYLFQPKGSSVSTWRLMWLYGGMEMIIFWNGDAEVQLRIPLSYDNMLHWRNSYTFLFLENTRSLDISLCI